MSYYSKVQIETTDGRKHNYVGVTRIEQIDNVVHLYGEETRHNESGSIQVEKHLGSYPIQNMFKWVKTPM